MRQMLKFLTAVMAVIIGASMVGTVAWAQGDNPLGRNQSEGQLLPDQAWVVAPDNEKGPGTLAHEPTGYQVGMDPFMHTIHRSHHHHTRHRVKLRHEDNGY